MEQTPDQIRRATVPAHHHGIIYGSLFTAMGIVIWFGGWAALHQDQVRSYPDYCTYAIKASMTGMTLFGAPPKREPGMSSERLRYNLLRYGNLDHRFDLEIIRHGWYPREASPAVWVREQGSVPPLYSEDASMVFKWPFMLTLLTGIVALMWGMISDYKYRSSIISGMQLEGSVIATVKEYNREVKGDGMCYRVAPWSDR